MTECAVLIGQLKTRRQRLGWSVTDLSERCGVDETLLTDWERGRAVPPLDGIEAWAAGLGLTLALVRGADHADHGRRGAEVDWAARRILVDGAPVRLAPMEWKALERLAWCPGELVSHEALFEHLYGETRKYRTESTAVRVLITKLRRLLPFRIEVRWGQGYVITGIAPSRSGQGRDGTRPAPSAALQPGRMQPDRMQPDRMQPGRMQAGAKQPGTSPVVPLSSYPPPRVPRDSGPQLADAVAAASHGPCREEELGIIDRFLAERGATRCPDVATIEKSPLPTLVWDKMKRKWVRPATTDCTAH